MSNEIWKDIEGYEGLYQVSNKGRVKSFHSGEGKIIKLGTHPQGYKLVVLSKRGQTKTCRVHRLVAQAFIPNPENLPVVNHKDENPSNNNVENLEWCTQKHNVNHGTCQERKENAKKKSKETGLKRVVDRRYLLGKFSKRTGELVDVFKDEYDAAQELGKNEDEVSEHYAQISGCLMGMDYDDKYDWAYI